MDTQASKKLINSIGSIYDEIKRTHTNVKKKGTNNFTILFLESRRKLVLEKFEKARELNAEVVALATPEQHSTWDYFLKQEYDALLTLYENVELYLSEHIERIQTEAQNRQAVNTQGSHLENSHILQNRLPELELPKFTGNFMDWLAFKDQFEAVVDSRDDIPDVRKLQYLRSCLSGEPERLIDSLSITAENYKTAWKNLIENYSRERVIVAKVMNKITEIRSVTFDNLSGLKYMRNTLRVAINTLAHFSIDLKHQFLVHFIVGKFDSPMRLKWETHTADNKNYPTFDHLEKFIDDRVQTLESFSSSTGKQKQKSAVVHNASVDSKSKCKCCDRTGHYLAACSKFNSKDPRERYQIVSAAKLCINCLSPKHFVKDCPSSYRCKTCKEKHHSLLHFESKKVVSNNAKIDEKQEEKPKAKSRRNKSDGTSENEATDSDASVNVSVALANEHQLATALVELRSRDGRTYLANIMLDSGSEVSFISERAVQNLKLPKTRVSLQITGVGDLGRQISKANVSFEIVSRHDESSWIKMSAFVLPKVTSYKPRQLDLNQFPHWKHLQFAAITGKRPADIDVLIGVDALPRILKGVNLISADKNVIAQSTIFGWVISGNLSASKQINVSANNCCQLDETLQKFWEYENVPTFSKLSVEEENCEKLYVTTTYQLPSGRFVVRLPFKTHDSYKQLGESRHIAEMSLNRMQKRLQKDEVLNKLYTGFINEYRELNHMRKLTKSEAMMPGRIFIPHHGVLKIANDKPKIRVVYNAAAKTSSGISLNETLSVGPKLQIDVVAILLNWRTSRYVFSTDIVKMYRQILIHEDDRIFQNIVWFDSETGEYEYYELSTVTYGLSPSPYLAIRTIREIANKCKTKYPHISNLLETSSFVDDVFAGANDIEELIQIKTDLTKVFATAQLELSKWMSNTNAIVEPNSEMKSVGEPDQVGSKVLGIFWCPNQDKFIISCDTLDVSKFTKRNVLSLIARIYDPMGWLSPVVIKFKQFMQKLWLAKIGWDDTLSEQLQREWQAIYQPLQLIRKFEIPRWYGSTVDSRVELLGFSDASALSYGAILYLRIIHADGKIEISMVMAKTRVAPLKTISIPRLELCAASLLADLVSYFVKNCTMTLSQIICFSDSKITLGWIAKHPSNWVTFVANRVSHIQTEIPNAKWSYIKSKMNPADLNSRGMTVPEFIDSELWQFGPEFLQTEKQIVIKNEFETFIEKRKVKSFSHAASTTPKKEPFDKVSSFSKLIRIFAYVYKFVNKLQNRGSESETTALTLTEIEQSKTYIIKRVQRAAYYGEIDALSKYATIKSNSNILFLNPFLDDKGVLRVGGRLEKSNYSTAQKHPIIIPQGNFAKKIIYQFHLIGIHGGTQLTLNLIRQEYWLINARMQTKSVIGNCIKCKREKREFLYQIMGSLPATRCSISRPFSYIGLDYAGPMLMKDRNGRGIKSYKCYIAVFICLTTRAVALELVTGLDAQSFLAALHRFVAHHGKPVRVTCDNGRNFVGGDNELKKAFYMTTHDPEILNSLAEQSIEFRFLPPYAPNMAGSQERVVRSVKYHLKRALGAFIPTWEEMYTLLARIEACLNSRPLCRLTDDPESLDALTPGHFLINGPLISLPEISVADKKETSLSRWKRVQQIVEHVWKRFSFEYLNTLQTRPKWKEMQKFIKVGDIVLIRNPNNPLCKWSLGKVIKVYMGVNGVPRIVDLKTSTTTLTRPITQLCPLIDIDQAGC